MLELLLYSYLIASLKYPDAIAAVADFVGRVKAHGRRWLAPARKQSASLADLRIEQMLTTSLARLDAYVTSMATP